MSTKIHSKHPHNMVMCQLNRQVTFCKTVQILVILQLEYCCRKGPQNYQARTGTINLDNFWTFNWNGQCVERFCPILFRLNYWLYVGDYVWEHSRGDRQSWLSSHSGWWNYWFVTTVSVSHDLCYIDKAPQVQSHFYIFTPVYTPDTETVASSMLG